MQKCSPVDMRKALEAVEMLKQAGIEFVAIPVLNQEQKDSALALMLNRLDAIEELVKDS